VSKQGEISEKNYFLVPLLFAYLQTDANLLSEIEAALIAWFIPLQ
jgi:hypothetical protein